jgi:hypothetical protein
VEQERLLVDHEVLLKEKPPGTTASGVLMR